jgi:biopolymer transport protein ExbD
MGVTLKPPRPVEKVVIDMTPMIDVVFQLLIFFMLTLKIKTDEGDFSINMPLGQSQATTDMMPDLKVRMVANPDGTLAALQFGRRNLGTGDRAYAELNQQVLAVIGRPGGAFSKDLAVEIDPDYELDYSEVMKAITAVSGRVDPISKQPRKYLEKVKFARPRKPKAG